MIRTRTNGLTRWQLKVLSPDGKVAPYDIPVTSQSEYARLAGDVRGNRIAFLLGSDSLEPPPPGALHLIIAEVPNLSNSPVAPSTGKPVPTKQFNSKKKP